MWCVGEFDQATWSLFAMMGVSSSCLREDDLAYRD